MRSDQSADVLWTTSNMENPRLSSSAENTSQTMFIRTDKISETLNDSDSDGGSSSELSDANTCDLCDFWIMSAHNLHFQVH